MRRKLVGVVFVILGLMIWAGGGVATPAGTVAVVSGSCTDHGHVLNRDETVQIGDTLDVPVGGSLKLRMADGSMISVASETSITVANHDSAGSVRAARHQLHGAAR